MKRWLRMFFVMSFLSAATSTLAASDGGAGTHRGGFELLPGVYLGELIAVIVYGLVGLALSIGGYMVFERVAPYPVRKEIEEDQNVALGIVIGSVIISIAMVVSAAIKN